jgi:hypothetical protein
MHNDMPSTNDHTAGNAMLVRMEEEEADDVEG